MECSVLVECEDGFWLHDLSSNTAYLGKEDFDRVLDSETDNNEFEAGWWCMVERAQGKGVYNSDRSDEG